MNNISWEDQVIRLQVKLVRHFFKNQMTFCEISLYFQSENNQILMMCCNSFDLILIFYFVHWNENGNTVLRIRYTIQCVFFYFLPLLFLS